MDYLYDGTFEGLMTAVYYHYKKEKADGIYEESNYQQSIVFQPEVVKTDIMKARTVSDAINKLISREAYIHVYYCYLSNAMDKENIILDFLIFGFKYGRNTMNFYTHEKVFPINEIYKRVAREENRILGILRFSDIGAILYAKYSPDNDISILLAEHFADRYKYERFIIYDERRKKAVVYFENNWEIKENINIDDVEFSVNEKEIHKLWKQYFTDLAIKERKNLNLQFQFVPARYRKNMTEFKL